MAPFKPNLYFINVLLTMLVLPTISISLDHISHPPVGFWTLIGKWFVFWAIGVRLFIAGLRQATKPSFTAKQIFLLQGAESYPIVRELGFGNISIGIGGLLSLLKYEWSIIMAIVGGLYFGFAGILHVVKKPDTSNERLALASDLFIFTLLAVYLFFLA